MLRVTFERFPAFLTAVTGNRVSERSLEVNLCILISKPKFEINSRLFMFFFFFLNLEGFLNRLCFSCLCYSFPVTGHLLEGDLKMSI